MKYALLVEDDYDLAKAIASELKSINFEVTHVADGRTGLETALKGGFSVIVLDLMLPELEGVEVCRQIRESDKLTPILILTARNDESDKVLLLELGADDFISKPFSLPEFRARVKALVRRSSLSAEPDEMLPAFEVGDLTIDPSRQKVSRDGQTLDLTVSEFQYLMALVRNPGRVYSREQLAMKVHGYEGGDYDQSVSSAINRLRAKLEKDPAKPEYILTVRGVGYSFAEIS
ncbi:UNVERIFIED_CONTAM: hypothetical protein GTU68_027809 [Idotea baltica]|nr:hypothetical protein [Idotea baltica]